MTVPMVEPDELGEQETNCGCCVECVCGGVGAVCVQDCPCDCQGSGAARSAVRVQARGFEAVTASEAAARRAEAAASQPQGESRRVRPDDGERARALPFPAKMRTRTVERDGRQLHEVLGYASTVDQPYEMWDFFGPYTEEIAGTAFDKTLAANPDVAFLLNHRGMTMARTNNKTLELSADALGLRAQAWLNPERQDVRDLVSAINDRLIDEMSFAFMINDAEWSEDFDKFTILEVDLNRGDVSAVNYGANPYTSIAARTREILHDVDRLPPGAARAAYSRLQSRTDLAPITAPKQQNPAPITAPAADNNNIGSIARYLAMLAED